ncbi:hypothetical protein [Bifidobacterium aerophilum]|uniref:Uncharacterized protein n=1 Tax=Bifidobacterium aerophilum TaxID=1798155 RepID=A0A6N9Z252_9BIFI|nr:hypothetical protein [Bifidobacterium aerophilum]NEG88622.1 hypothetical protein [Bifidobacterium aerophilum]
MNDNITGLTALQTSPSWSSAGSPFATGSASAPFGMTNASCPCRTVVANGRDLIALHERAVRRADDMTAAARTAASSIAWEGNAATLFRQRLDDCLAAGRRARDEAAAAHRLAWGGGR